MIRRIIRSEGLSLVDDRYSKRIQEYKDSLVAHYPLNDLVGGVAIDRTGRNDGAVTGATPGQPGIGDGLKSMGFDGLNDFVDISAIASNLISNGGFETVGAGGADIWADWHEEVSDGALANEVVNIHTGADACKVTAGANTNTHARSTITVVPGAINKLRFWTEGDGTHAGRYGIFDISNSSYILTIRTTGVTAAAYTMVDVEFTAPAGCTSVWFFAYCADNNTSVCYFDTVSLRRTDVPTFDPHEGSAIGWAKIPDWTDGAVRRILSITLEGANRFRIFKALVDNTIQMDYVGNNVTKSQATNSYSPAGFFPVGFTWSLSGDKVIYYLDGAQTGATDISIGVMTGALSIGVLGALNTTPTNPFHGNLAHAQLYNTPHDADTMKYLMRRPS